MRRRATDLKRRSKKRRRQNAYGKYFLRLGRIEAVRDLGDHRRWSWQADPSSIAREPDTFEPTRNDGYAEYEGHFAFDLKEGRVWIVDSEKKIAPTGQIGQDSVSNSSQEG